MPSPPPAATRGPNHWLIDLVLLGALWGASFGRQRQKKVAPSWLPAASGPGVVFLDEHITAWMLLCAAVIVCGVALSIGVLGAGRGCSGTVASSNGNWRNDELR